MLKRGLSATIEEWIMSAEYIMAGGNDNVILCEHGQWIIVYITKEHMDWQETSMINELVELDSVYTKRITDLLTEDPARIGLKVAEVLIRQD